MLTENTTLVTTATNYGRGLGNLTIENAQFFGRPNFAGEMNQFKDERRQFTIRIPNEMADELRALGWNVKTRLAAEEGEEDISHLRVMVDFRPDKKAPNDISREKGPDVWLIQGEDREKLNSNTVALLDRSRITQMDLEIRAWEYNPDEEPGKYSARLVALVVVREPNVLGMKYGIM